MGIFKTAIKLAKGDIKGVAQDATAKIIGEENASKVVDAASGLGEAALNVGLSYFKTATDKMNEHASNVAKKKSKEQ